MQDSLLITAAVMLIGCGCATAPASEPVGRGARLFVTKCYPAHGKLSDKNFRQLADAGFTVVVNKWDEDVPRYCRGAAAAGMDVMTWAGGMPSATGPDDQVVTRTGQPTRYARPVSAAGWKKLADRLVQSAHLSVEHTNYKGVILDFEIYDKNKTDGFCESYDAQTFTGFLQRFNKTIPEPLTPPNERRAQLEKLGLLGDYIQWQYEQVGAHAARMRQALDAVNPNFQIGVYGWGVLSGAVMENVATRQAPVLDINAETYARSTYDRKFPGGYDRTRSDRPGLKWSLVTNAKLAQRARNLSYPVVFLGGHYPQAPGPDDGTQFNFTVRQAFNSAAYADGYWIWTDWGAPKPWPNTQAWIDAMMADFAEANAALDAGDDTWAGRQAQQIADPIATTPLLILTTNGKVTSAWDPIAGQQAVADAEALKAADWSTPAMLNEHKLRINGHDLELVDTEGSVQQRFTVGHGLRGVAVGDVDGVAGAEIITLNAGWIRIWEPESGVTLLRFRVGNDQTRVAVDPRFTR